ncbi:MAG: thioredoxin family protein [Bacteroidales bacterium]|nr:thioredoxin family protein [Bacteroidales bacterium]
MKNLLLAVLLLFGLNSFAQVYDENIDGMKQIQEAVAKAKKENKQVLIQVGGNWCKYCIKLHNWINDDVFVKSTIDKYYVYIDVNYSNKNKNFEAMKFLRWPQRFPFPSLYIISNKGEVLHTQKITPLTTKNEYDTEKFIAFLKEWTVFKLDPKSYK